MRILFNIVVAFLGLLIFTFYLLIFVRDYNNVDVYGIRSVTNISPFIRADAEIVGSWSLKNDVLTLFQDKTFRYQTHARVITGNWMRQDDTLSLMSDSDGCCKAMRFITLHEQYFLLTDPPDFAEVEGVEWLETAIISALKKEKESKTTDVSGIPDQTECRDTKTGLEIIRLVGNPVTLRGKFELEGTIGPYITCGSERVYLEAHPNPVFSYGSKYEKIQHKIVNFTGILRFSHFDSCTDAQDREGMCQHPPDYYYFDEETAKVSVSE